MQTKNLSTISCALLRQKVVNRHPQGRQYPPRCTGENGRTHLILIDLGPDVASQVGKDYAEWRSMRVIVSHNRRKEEIMKSVDRSFDDLFKGFGREGVETARKRSTGSVTRSTDLRVAYFRFVT